MGFVISPLGFLFFVLALVSLVANGDPLVPALHIFGDSLVDVGNNNYLITTMKANFPPYGRDFFNHTPTGRFCNGKLAIDFIADWLGFTMYQPAYLSQEASGENLLTGANFASAASGLYEGTARLYNTIPLTQQLDYYKEYQTKVVKMVGREKADMIFSEAIHLLSTGSSDFIQNYYTNPLLSMAYSVDQFSDVLMARYTDFIQKLYGLGARRIGVTTLPPLGCLPATITLFGTGKGQCVDGLNQVATSFNNKLNRASHNLVINNFPNLKLLLFDIYHPILDMVTKPCDYGFLESGRACCGTGSIEISIECNARSLGTCSNATKFVFWDGFHLSESANHALSNNILLQGMESLSYFKNGQP